MGLPLFAGLDLGLILESQARMDKGDPQGLTSLVETLGKTGGLRVVRKLAAIWSATDLELKMAESDPAVMAQLEEKSAERLFVETFKDAMLFHSALWASLPSSPTSSDATEQNGKSRGKRVKASVASPSEG
jgi:hypothetical protein